VHASLLWAHRLLLLPLVVSAFASLPRRLSLGTVSVMGALTVLQAVALGGGVLACVSYPRGLPRVLLPYMLFLLWAVVSVIRAPPGLEGAQNGIVYVLFGFTLVLSATMAARNRIRLRATLGLGLRWIHWVALGLILSQVALYGFPKRAGQFLNAPSVWQFGPRSIAILGLLPMTWYLTRWYYRQRGTGVGVALWVGAIVVSLSRTATVAAVLLVAVVILLQARFTPRRAMLALPVFALTVLTIGALVVHSDVFRDRVFAGDASIEVAGTRINASGRMAFWGVVVASAAQQPIIGKGLGSSQTVVGEAFRGVIVHPHNDYLRVWHDFGLVGAFLLLWCIGSWLLCLLRRWYAAEARRVPSEPLELGAFLALLGFAMVMLTDNALIYPFVMGPLGTVVGAGLGAGLGTGAATRRAHTPPRVPTAKVVR
jgi:O-antigen ligase